MEICLLIEQGSYSYAASELQGLLLKYLLQVSIYNRYGFYPEFSILRTEDRLSLYIYRYEKVFSRGGIFFKLLLSEKNGQDTININCRITPTRVDGKISVSDRFFDIINEFNHNVSSLLRIGCFIMPGDPSSEDDLSRTSGSLNRRV